MGNTISMTEIKRSFISIFQSDTFLVQKTLGDNKHDFYASYMCVVYTTNCSGRSRATSL